MVFELTNGSFVLVECLIHNYKYNTFIRVCVLLLMRRFMSYTKNVMERYKSIWNECLKRSCSSKDS